MSVVGAVIVVPEDLKDTILLDGYRCSRRRRIPCSRDAGAALRAWRQFNPGRQHSFLRIVNLPPGTDAEVHKDGFKINVGHLPGHYLALVTAAYGLGVPAAAAVAAAQPCGGFGVGGAWPAAANVFAPPRRSALGSHPSELELRDIFFTQDSCANYFQDSRTLAQTESELRAGFTSPSYIETVTVVHYDGKWYTVDNRRVCVYKRVYPGNYTIPVRIGSADFRFHGKRTTTNGGTSIRVRG